MAPYPPVLLPDESFSSLEADLRAEIREQVRGDPQSQGGTAVFVTHDPI